jgi:hypothetical protein
VNERIIIASVAMHTNKLTDLELAALNNVVQLDMDPHGRIFDYNKVAGLFSEANGTRAHSMTKDALATIVLKRLKG